MEDCLSYLYGIQKMHFSENAILDALLYSGLILSTFQTISIQNSSRIPFGCKKCVCFARYATLVPRLISGMFKWFLRVAL